MKKSIFFSYIVLIISIASCSLIARKEFRSTMRDIYQKTETLYSYIWDEKQFKDPANKAKIKELLDAIDQDFHQVDTITTVSDNKTAKNDPSFIIALQSQSRLLKRAKTSLENGELDLSLFTLKGMTENCVSCHSRFNVTTDFVGTSVRSTDTSVEARLSEGEFLIATRQFKKAEDSLFQLAEELASLKSGTGASLDALRLWLLVKIRVQEEFSSSADYLSKLKEKPAFTTNEKLIVSKWIVDLKDISVSKFSIKTDPTDIQINKAKELLGDISNERLELDDEKDFIKTAFATAILHELLIREITEEERKTVYLLISAAYSRITIPFLENLSSLYLETVIRTYPGSAEAKTAYQLFKRKFDYNHTGSGGESVEKTEEEFLNELRDLSGSK